MRPLPLRPALLVAAVLVGGAASAQPMWRPAPEGASVSLDVLKPFDDDLTATDEQGNTLSTFSTGLLHSAQVLSARFPVTAAFTVVADLPTAYFKYDASEFLPDEDGEFGVGNPYVGVEARPVRDVAVEAGVRLPLSSKGERGAGSNASYTGVGALFETPEAFLEGAFSASLGARFEPALLPSLRLRLRAVPTVLVYSSFRGTFFEDGTLLAEDVRETILALHYGAQVMGDLGQAELSVGVIGRTDDATPFETFAGSYKPTTLVLGASVGGLPVRPSATVRMPLRNGPFGNNAVVGLSLDVSL